MGFYPILLVNWVLKMTELSKSPLYALAKMTLKNQGFEGIEKKREQEKGREEHD